jgi:hypothetical protein
MNKNIFRDRTNATNSHNIVHWKNTTNESVACRLLVKENTYHPLDDGTLAILLALGRRWIVSSGSGRVKATMSDHNLTYLILVFPAHLLTSSHRRGLL